MKNTVTIIDNRTNKEYEFDIVDATRGPSVVDISTFYTQTGMFTYDNGYTSTASCKSDITFIDGTKGELRYRGIEISELAQKHSYLDVCYLLLNSKLPSEEELNDFDLELRHRAFLHEGLRHLFQAFPAGAHPMATLSAATAALSTFYYDHLNINNENDYQEMARRIIAKIPTIAAFAFRHSIGAPFIHPDIDRSFSENFLYMLRAYPGGKMHRNIKGENVIREIEIKALDTIFTLHADHEQNASTTTVRSVASTGAHPYVAISAGISALWGRAHGGANESVIAQLEMIGSVENVDSFIARVKDPNDSFRLMGFGHRVYKNFDPRAKILKELQDQLKKELVLDSHLMDIAHKIEEIALNDEYFIKRNLYPNIDFYSGVILTALKIPKSMFTPVFVIGRTVGWITQWIEFKKDKTMKIARPRQLYLGK
ncbi:MAG: citrate synthase [Sulfurimonas sp.]|nr:citrate synthase [Sulfurimonas sp.]MBU1217613.1 citrate synthase [bacterium]MBU1435264.1 citrate synthase [bacterium]MBU1502881.1 citrate synthase [bacterium]MBU3938240.1 citrate synthase [bacterium]